MKRYVILLIFASIFSTIALAQNKGASPNEYGFSSDLQSFKGNKYCRLSKGSCKNVLDLLRVSQENDSMAINIFREEYNITNMRRTDKEWILNKNYSEIIQFFSREKNGLYYCELKTPKNNDFILLSD